MSTLQSSCLCGAVSWDISGELSVMSHCHCSRCRKTRGIPFSTEAAADAAGFVLRGAEHVTGCSGSPQLTRNFCRHCGSMVPSPPWHGIVFVPAGNFAGDPGIRPSSHIFVASKAPWYEIPDQLPQYDAYPPGVDAAALDDLSRSHAGGAPRGSCLCGGVRFELLGTPIIAHNCHCTRCRKKSSGAYSSSFVVGADEIRFLAGRELLVTYKLPEAKHFGHTFCRVCAGKLPQIDRVRNIALVPFGAMDDDPGIRPLAHIYVGSKAPWFEIRDSLPRFAEHYNQS